MGNYQVLFSGEVTRGVREEAVQANLARELGIDDRKARALFSGRTVVIRSQLSQEDALRLQTRFADFGAICRIKDLTPKTEPKLDFRIDRQDRGNDQSLRDITAAHVECPRCSHLQLEASHCARCGIDIGAALKAKRKEDLLIEKKIREMRDGRQVPRPKNVEEIHFETAEATQPAQAEKKPSVMSWFKKTS